MNHSSVCTELSWQLTSVNTKQESDVCILCQDESRVNVAMVAAAFVQLSSVLSKQRISTDEALKKIGDVTIPAGVKYYVLCCLTKLVWCSFFTAD